MTSQELKDKIRTIFGNVGDGSICSYFADDAWDNYFKEADLETIHAKLLEEFGEIKEVDSFGGEGQGDQYWKVFHLPKIDRYLQIYGYYASHYGHEWNSIFIVVPKEKTIIEWEFPTEPKQ
jgi:hypothetical protein